MTTTATEWDNLSPDAALLRLPAETGNIARVESAVMERCPAQDLGEKQLLHLRLLIDEIFSNICRHAYARPASGVPAEMAVHVEPYDSRQKRLCFWAVDWGAPFDAPAAIPATPPISPSFALERQRPKKLGLYLISRSCHSLEYKRAPFPQARAANLLRVCLFLGESSPQPDGPA